MIGKGIKSNEFHDFSTAKIIYVNSSAVDFIPMDRVKFIVKFHYSVTLLYNHKHEVHTCVLPGNYPLNIKAFVIT